MATGYAPVINTGDNAWVLASAALVLMMTAPGLILFYGGLVRRKNVLGTMMQSLVLMALVSVLWMVFGYSMAFGEGNAFCGNPFQYFMLKGVGAAPNPAYAPTIPQESFMLFQMMFAIITPALISGAIAERMRFKAYMLFMTLWVTFIYFPVVPHGLGPGRPVQLEPGRPVSRAGFRRRHGGACQFGRLGAGLRGGAGKANWFPGEPMPPHNVVLSLIGAGLLWVGWFGFNAGSALNAGGWPAARLRRRISRRPRPRWDGERSSGCSRAGPACSGSLPAWLRAWPPSRPPRVS